MIPLMADPTHTPNPDRELPANYHFQDYARGWSDSLDLSIDIVETHALALHRAGKHDAARAVQELVDKLTPRTPRLDENVVYRAACEPTEDDGA